MAVFCNKCGKELLEQARFCPFCGVVSKRTVDGSIAFIEPEQGPYCPACGKRTVEKSKHCMWCGLDVHARPEGAGALICPGCGEKNPEDSGFCSRCRMDFVKWFAGSTSEARILAGRYRLDEELGRGGMGVVYRGLDTELDMPVAIKMVPAELARNKNAVATLKKEAKVAIQLTHPNINRLYTFGQTGKEAFLVMEYVEGQTLEDLLQQKGKPPEKDVVKIGLAILAGLAEAHKRNVIHRDLKPANIMLSNQGEVKILDFGIARVLKETMTRFSRQVSTSSGTLLYMSPEQVKGKRETPESDLYSFGAMLYELLSGNPPFFRGALEHQILNEPPEPLEGVSPWLNEVILRCLAKDPSERYATAQDLAKALRAGASAAPPPRPPAPPPRPEPEPVREHAPVDAGKRKKQLVWGALALAIACVVLLAWYLGIARPRARDEAACELARKVDIESGWNAYIKERPEGVCKAEAEKRLAELAAAERERLAKAEAERLAAEEEAKRKASEKEAKKKASEKAKKKIRWVYSRPAGIWFAKSETTVSKYRACVNAGKCTRPKKGKYCNWGKSGRGRHPVNCVDWYQAKAFCEWVGGRLPTEKEWEREASNRGKRKYPWGNEEVSCSYAVMDDGKTKGSAGAETDGCGEDRTWPVCSKTRGNSVSGLCDMSGNVWEWTSSWSGKARKYRVLRGGSWGNGGPDDLRASSPHRVAPAYRNLNCGFRCGRSSQ